MKGVNVHLYPSPLTNESRILKITKSLAQAGVFNSIYCIGLWKEGLEEKEILDDTRQIWRLRHGNWRSHSGLLHKVFGLVQWMWKVIVVLRKERIACLSCHHITLLPLCVLLKWTHKCVLVYDTHELETERAGISGVVKLIAKFVERLFARYAEETLVVSSSIAQWYRKAYPRNSVHVVRNVPYNHEFQHRDTALLKKKFRIPDEHLLFLYQGAIGAGRGIQLLLNVFSKLESDKHIVFMGYGNLASLVEEYAQRCTNIHFHPAVPPDRLHEHTVGADVGLSLIENTCLSYYYCLPNKLFEYIQCGLPVVVSDFPDMGGVIDEYQCGWKVAPTEDEITELIKKLTMPLVRRQAEKTKVCRGKFGWEKEEEVLLHVYRDLFPELEFTGVAH